MVNKFPKWGGEKTKISLKFQFFANFGFKIQVFGPTGKYGSTGHLPGPFWFGFNRLLFFFVKPPFPWEKWNLIFDTILMNKFQMGG